MSIELRVFLKGDCELTKPEPSVLIDIYNHTNGDPCNGCGCKSDCNLYPKLGKFSKKNKKLVKSRDIKSTPTNSEIAAEKGISKRQAAKLRRAGKL